MPAFKLMQSAQAIRVRDKHRRGVVLHMMQASCCIRVASGLARNIPAWAKELDTLRAAAALFDIEVSELVAQGIAGQQRAFQELDHAIEAADFAHGGVCFQAPSPSCFLEFARALAPLPQNFLLPPQKNKFHPHTSTPKNSTFPTPPHPHPTPPHTPHSKYLRWFRGGRRPRCHEPLRQIPTYPGRYFAFSTS